MGKVPLASYPVLRADGGGGSWLLGHWVALFGCVEACGGSDWSHVGLGQLG